MYNERTNKLHFSALFLLVFTLLHTALAQGKPNIVLILADDVSADMFSCYGQPGAARTPNIDRIAAEGVQFETCFAPAICAAGKRFRYVLRSFSSAYIFSFFPVFWSVIRSSDSVTVIVSPR